MERGFNTIRRWGMAALVMGAPLNLVGAESEQNPEVPNAEVLATEMATAELAVGKVLFNRKCAKCHTAEEPVNDIGPSLYQVVGRRAGSLPDFDYSSSIQNSSLVWTEGNLLKYINDPNAFIPCKKIQIKSLTMCTGIHMKFQGFKNPYAAKAVVAYLKSTTSDKK